MRFYLCIFQSDTVKSDCSVQIFRKNDEIFKDLIQTVGIYFTSFTVFFSGDIKKSSEKKSENNQSTGHFQSFLFFRPPNPKSEKKSRKSTNKKIWPKHDSEKIYS